MENEKRVEKFYMSRSLKIKRTILLRPHSLAAPRISPHEVLASHASKTQPPTEVSELPKMMWRHPIRWWQLIEDQMTGHQLTGNGNFHCVAARAPYQTSRRGEAAHATMVLASPMGWKRGLKERSQVRQARPTVAVSSSENLILALLPQ